MRPLSLILTLVSQHQPHILIKGPKTWFSSHIRFSIHIIINSYIDIPILGNTTSTYKQLNLENIFKRTIFV